MNEARTGATADLDAGRLSNPWATCLVVAALSLVFGAQWRAGAVDPAGGGYGVFLVGGLHAPSVREGEVFRIVTAPLLHMHVHHYLANAAALLGLGAILEAQIGHARLLVMIALSMLAGSIANVVLPASGGVSVGASGVLWVLPFALVGDAAVALLLPARIGWVAHLAGFVGGMAAMAVVARGAGPIPLAGPPHRTRMAAALLCGLFLLGAAVDVERVATGRICRVMERDDLSAAMREGFDDALRRLAVSCAEPVNEAG
jgi:membrane associated rhomboid family serine protease